MNESAQQELEALTHVDGQQALGLMVRVLVHEMRNAINPMGMQIAILRRYIREPDEDVKEVLDGLHETMVRAHNLLDSASKLGHDFAPSDDDDADTRKLWDRVRDLL